jgi:hypothetical protein
MVTRDALQNIARGVRIGQVRLVMCFTFEQGLGGDAIEIDNGVSISDASGDDGATDAAAAACDENATLSHVFFLL